jgi:signal peptidase I
MHLLQRLKIWIALFFGIKDDDFFKEMFLPLCAYILLRTFFVDWFHVPSSSMSPVIYRGDYVLIAKYRYGYSPASITLNLGSWLVPRKTRYRQDGTPIPINSQTNNQVIAGQVPYIKFAPVKVGDIVCIADPRVGGLNLTKRVIGISGDSFQMIDNDLYINDEPCSRRYIGSHHYSSDFGRLERQDCYLETLPNGTEHVIQYGANYPPCTTSAFSIPAPVLTKLLGCVTSIGYFSVIGNNRDGSTDSRHGTLMLHAIPEDWLFGAVLGTLFSTHHSCALPSFARNTGWIEFIVKFPWNFVRGAVAALGMLERVGLVNDEPHRHPELVHSPMKTLFGPSAYRAKYRAKHNLPVRITGIYASPTRDIGA